MIIHFLIFPYHCYYKRFFCRLNRTGPINVNMRFQTLCIFLSVLLFCYTKLRTDPHVNKDFFLFEFFSKDSLSCSKVGATHVSTKPRHFTFFFRVKVDAPLSSADVKFLLNQAKEEGGQVCHRIFFMSLDRGR